MTLEYMYLHYLHCYAAHKHLGERTLTTSHHNDVWVLVSSLVGTTDTLEYITLITITIDMRHYSDT